MALNIIVFVKALVNTLVRLFPIGLYSGSIMSSLIFDDNRGTMLFLGFMINEMISLGYRMAFKSIYNPQCALLKSGDTNFVLPAPITQTVGFFVSFILMEMYYDGEFIPVKFFVTLCLVMITIWSRNNIGCKSILDAVFSTLIGTFIGVSYYIIIKDFYKKDYYTENKEDTHSEKVKKIFFDIL